MPGCPLRCAVGQRRRRSRSDPPARIGDAGAFARFAAKQQHGHARRFRRQHQPARRGQIERLGLAPALDHQRPEPGAARGIVRGLEQRCIIAEQPEDEVTAMEADFT